jgi:hypothetical protein
VTQVAVARPAIRLRLSAVHGDGAQIELGVVTYCRSRYSEDDLIAYLHHSVKEYEEVRTMARMLVRGSAR